MSKPTAITQTIEVGGKTLTLETGRLAKQADGAVVASMGDTMTLNTAVMDKKMREGQHFFPLTCDYRERYSAKGAFPGGFFKREGRPTEKEVLTSRLIDRVVRPLFPEGFRNEVQVLSSLQSADTDIDGDVLAGVGSSAALHLSGAPFDGPTAHVRVGRVDGEWVVFPTRSELESSDFDLIAAGKADAIAMVEGEMDEVSEADMVEALEVAHEAIQKICAGIEELRRKYEAEHGAIEAIPYETVAPADELVEKVYGLIRDDVNSHLRADYDKDSFYGGIDEIKERLLVSLFGEGEDEVEEIEGGYTRGDVKEAFKVAESRVMREMILDDGRRLDGRATDEVRDIWTEVDYLPRVHGSAIFTRGETQALVKATLGTGRDVQAVDNVFEQEDKRFYLHYNFPPFCVGETRFLRGPSRREIGHGNLAERSLRRVVPDADAFPYTVRVVSDILESNGSSSMATVCGGSMALMAAGVPVKKPVAGIAMGLVKEGEKVAILSDILGTEDHLGDMDFKLTGTPDGITACQMDIKIAGLEMSLMREALEQAKAGRDHIHAGMAETIEAPREELSPTAPRLIQILIDQDLIGAVIGPGGKIIRSIQDESGAQVDVDDQDGKGVVTISAPNMETAQKAVEIVKGIVAQPEVGEKYDGTVRKILPFGAIMEILPGKEAMLHISEMSHGYVDKVEDVVEVGDKLEVQLIEVRKDGKLRLSRKPFLPKPEGGDGESRRNGSSGKKGGKKSDGGREN